MKQPLSSKTAGIVIAVTAVIALAAGFGYYFKDSFTPQPTVKPKPWSPPGAWGGAPGTNGSPGPGAPPKPDTNGSK